MNKLPLGRITGDVQEFEKSLNSANARVLGGIGTVKLAKRTWCYAARPATFGIPGCKCGNENCEYSEFTDKLWCAKCEIDFEPEHWGVFDGPILIECCHLLGMCFDRIDLVRDVYQEYRKEDGEWDWFDLSKEELDAKVKTVTLER